MLKPGDKAPEFSVNDQNGNTVKLSDFVGKKVVLYFYPKDNTSGCTKEACDFRDAISQFENNNTVVLGVSVDSISSHQKFITKYELPFTLLSDSEKNLVNDYGVWKEKNMCGKKYMGIERSTFVIDEKGIITKVFNKVKVPGHVTELLKLVEA
ncbi:MAG TPA: thioredoxin-dependent thiol peroxidase [Melioribacteraceae bacterium]|nr:thioredoxin-dependent thiol peroxidase [Melioribacteraceae bacterium]